MSLPRLCRPLPRLQHRNTTCPIFPAHSIITVRGLSAHALSTPLGDPSSSSTFPAVNQKKLRRLKYPSRGGQDLSKRYQRLERSIRGKTSYDRGIEDFERSGGVTDPAPYTKDNDQAANTATGKLTRRIFRGFVVPDGPKPPEDDECCMSGCAICVYDLYDEARTDHIQAMDQLRADLTKLGVPESEWPTDIWRDGQGSHPALASRLNANASLSAFEQLELALKAKREDTSGSTIVTLEG
ncbi:hypothetical protein LXA43DRAFT_5433 [Ganoderma leucocontextum]|nr:hypothetical protein LXA43DRAFT_5433 [Ganoderma leucocontextum]